MSDVVTLTDAARAVLAVAEGEAERAIAVVACVAPDGAVQRMIVDETGAARGTLGDAWLNEAAQRRAQAALEQREHEPVTELLEHGGATRLLYVQAHWPPERLLIVGAGHIAVPLAHLGLLLGFRVPILDDRDEFATQERFDARVAVYRTDFTTDPFAGVDIDERTFVALVTRGHRWDVDCLRRIVESGAAPRYIGMIGSRRRVRAAFEALLAAGTTRDALAGIHAPIGLEIGAETPEEIAVAIAAELVAVRRGAQAATTTGVERVLERLIRDEKEE
jgi:xanthine dehydrogenase accessory factor